MKTFGWIAAATAALLVAPVAYASDIDTTGGVTPGTTGIEPFGSPDTATYGQTFTAGAGDNFLQSFTMYLGDRNFGSGPLDFLGYIGTWDGAKLGSIVYTSALQTKTDGGLSQFLFNTPDLALTAGSQYVAFLSISDLALQPDSAFYMPIASNALAGGNFVFFNNGTDFGQLTSSTWSAFMDYDVAFKADFSESATGTVGSAVPEPATWAMMILGFAVIGGAMRKRQQAKVSFAF